MCRRPNDPPCHVHRQPGLYVWIYRDMSLIWVVRVVLLLISGLMGQTWGPSGADRTQVGPMFVLWIAIWDPLMYVTCASYPICRVWSVTGEFPAQMASNTENASIWWRHHGLYLLFSASFPPAESGPLFTKHYSDAINSAMASQITGASNVCSTVCSGADQRKHHSSVSLAFVRRIHRWPVDSPHKIPITQKMYPIDYVIMKRRIGNRDSHYKINIVWLRSQFHIVNTNNMESS